MKNRLHLLIVSQVFPFPLNAGQHQRVYYKLKALRSRFYITFLAAVPREKISDVRQKLLEHCDEVILLPALYTRRPFSPVWYKLMGIFFSWRTGLKFSNYLVGKVEFKPERIQQALVDITPDGALFEYWHAARAASVLRAQGIPCVLDMHDILWKSYAHQLDAHKWLPVFYKQWAVIRYQRREEEAWKKFDALISINTAEHDYTRSRLSEDIRVFYAPMGTDMAVWPYSWEPVRPLRFAYYGGLGSRHNQQDAISCYQDIMPGIWEKIPDAELWIVGSNPPDFIHSLPSLDRRVTVTGYVENVQEVLKNVYAVLCPWSGTYGFRSRIVEVMALGIPVIASPESVHGMDLEADQGIFLERTPDGMARACLKLAADSDFARRQSLLARQQVEEKYSYTATYEQLAEELLAFFMERRRTANEIES